MATKQQDYTSFTLDYLFHNYKYIKRKLTALEMRKVAQRRMAERLVAMGLESKVRLFLKFPGGVGDGGAMPRMKWGLPCCSIHS